MSLAVVGLVIGLGLIGAVATGTRAVLHDGAPEPADAAREPLRATAEPQARARSETALATRFDVIRVEPDGAGVVAGKTLPLAEVELLVGGATFARTRSDEAGNFVLVPPPFPAGSSEITLRSTGRDGVPALGPDSATVVVAADRRTPPLVAVSRDGQPTLVLSRPDDAGPVPPGAAAPVKVVSVDAEAGGRLHVAAQGAPRTEMRLYLNDTLVAPGRVAPDGRVSFTIGRGVRSGDYKVRVDQVDPASGTVKARSEVPFAYPRALDAPATAAAPRPGSVAGRSEGGPPRAGATVVAEMPGGAAGSMVPQVASAGEPGTVFVPGVGTAQVVKGDNLWSISRRAYGHGLRYTVIFGANQPQIRNPNRIYPGQVFVLPGDGLGKGAAADPADKRS
ncbi:MAG: LysM peptidoglycan-binding domain-containing protein [Methylobacterium frigidaeris]